jgi:hypothetical protein
MIKKYYKLKKLLKIIKNSKFQQNLTLRKNKRKMKENRSKIN